MYDKITNPITGKNVNINSNLGKQILKNYLNMIGGSNGKFRRAVGVVRASNRFKSGGLRYIEKKINNLVDNKIIEYNINNGYASLDLSKLDITNCPEYINYVNDLINEYNKNSFLKNDILAIMSELTNMDCVGKDLKINKINRDDRNDWGFFVAIGILILKINVDKYKNLCNLVRKGVGLGYTIVSNSNNQSGGSDARRKFKSAVIAVKLSSSMLKDIRLREQGLKNTVNLMVNNNVEVDREKSSMDISKSNILLNGAEELINLEDKNKNKRIVGLLNLLKIDCVLSGGSMSQSVTRGLISGALGVATAATVLAFAPCYTTGMVGALAVNATVGTCATGVLTGGGYTTWAIVGAGLGSAVNTYRTSRIRGAGSGNNTGEEMEIPENIVLAKSNRVLSLVKGQAQDWLDANTTPPAHTGEGDGIRIKKWSDQRDYCEGIINIHESKSDELVTMFESRKSWKHGDNSGLRKFLLKYTGVQDAITGVDSTPDDDTAILPAITYNGDKVDTFEFTGLSRNSHMKQRQMDELLRDNKLGWELNYDWPKLWCGNTGTKPPLNCNYPSHILELAEPNNIISRYARTNGDFTYDDTTGKWIDNETKEEINLHEDDGNNDTYTEDLGRETDKDRIFLAPEIIREVNNWYSLSDMEKQHTLPPLYFIVCKGENMPRLEAVLNPILEILGATPFKHKGGAPDVGHLSCIFIVNKKVYSFGLGYGAPVDVTIGGHPKLRELVKKLGGEYNGTKFDMGQLGGSMLEEAKEQLHHNLMAALYTPDYVIEPTRRTSSGKTFDYKIVDMGILSQNFANNINDYIKQHAINMGYNQDDMEDSSSHAIIGYFVYMNLIYEEFSKKKDNDGTHHCATFLENMFPGKIACDLPPFSLDKRTVGTGIITTLGTLALGGVLAGLGSLLGVPSATLLLISQGASATSVVGYHAAIATLLSKKGRKAMRVLYGFSAPWHCKRKEGQYTPKDLNAIWNLMEGMRLGEATGGMRDICIENRFGEKLEKILNGPGGHFKYKTKDVAIEQPAMKASNTGWFSKPVPDERKQRARRRAGNVEEAELKALGLAELKTKAGELSLTNKVIEKYGSRAKKATYIAAIMASNNNGLK